MSALRMITRTRERLQRVSASAQLADRPAAAPAGASRVTGPTGIANSARAAVIATAPADPLGRKVG